MVRPRAQTEFRTLYTKIAICAKILYFIICRIIKTGITPDAFGTTGMSLISKDINKLSYVSMFRPIACLNVEGKILWAILSQRVIQFCKENGYLRGKIQKGVLPGISGCIEHTYLLMAALKDAKRSNHTIVVTFIDLANAYGSVNHSLIHFAMSWFHIPKSVCGLIQYYYNALFAKVVTSQWSTSEFPFRIGVFQGCTISPILFDLVYQLCINYVKDNGTEPYAFSNTTLNLKAKHGIIEVDQEGYADDHTLLNRTPRGAQCGLDLISRWLKWILSMMAKPPKCRSFELYRNNVSCRAGDPNTKDLCAI